MAITNHCSQSTPASPQQAANAIVNESEVTQYSASLFEQSFEHSEGDTALQQYTEGSTALACYLKYSICGIALPS